LECLLSPLPAFSNPPLLSHASSLQRDLKIAQEQDENEIARIASLPKSHEKRVISFGLYGNNTKYTHGAIKNTELAKVLLLLLISLASLTFSSLCLTPAATPSVDPSAAEDLFPRMDLSVLCHG
jgi:hypothetical protein